MSVTGTPIVSPSVPATYTEQLASAKTRLNELLATPAQSYKTSTGQSGSEVYYRDLKELRDTIEWLENKIALENGKGRTRLAVLRIP